MADKPACREANIVNVVHSVAGTPAAVRVVSEAAAEGAAMREVAAYQRLAELQGNLVPRLLAYGQTTIRAGTAFYVATEFVEVGFQTLAH